MYSFEVNIICFKVPTRLMKAAPHSRFPDSFLLLRVVCDLMSVISFEIMLNRFWDRSELTLAALLK